MHLNPNSMHIDVIFVMFAFLQQLMFYAHDDNLCTCRYLTTL